MRMNSSHRGKLKGMGGPKGYPSRPKELPKQLARHGRDLDAAGRHAVRKALARRAAR